VAQRNDIGADLHTHSTASDGLDTPGELVKLASSRGVSILAISDHDTVSGVAEAQKVGPVHGVTIIPAVEFSVRSYRGQTHILGYGIDIANAELTIELENLRLGREERGLRMLERLRDIGISLDPEVAEADRAGGSPGRPHIARELVKIGAAESIQDAFNRYLAVGRPAFVPRRTLAAGHAIDLIRNAGGLAVLAHPLSVYELESELPSLVQQGLAGLEIYYGEYGSSQSDSLAEWATTYNLLATGGSDYHGSPESGGRVLGSVRWPREALEALLQRLK
jgi:3',5'-nucleoside bisphosphate phosphatase